MRTWRAVLAVTVCLGLASCGDGDGGTHAARCEAACNDRPASGGCADADRAACKNSCVAQTEGLSALCAQCMIEHSYWDGCTCTCYGTGCCALCGKGPFLSCEASDSCEASQETCEGFRLGSASGDCVAQCSVGGPDAG
jgi:hypothetical protein